jgi:hypothetical protein
MAESSKKEIEQFQKAWAQMIARAWADESFKQKLLRKPEEVFREYGFQFPKGMKIVENTPSATYLVLPSAPQGEFSEADLKQVAAGSGISVRALQDK